MEADRGDRSHIRLDGQAKASFPTREAAAVVADSVWMTTGKPHNAYLCDQKPDHWHVGHGTPDLLVG